MHVNIINDTIRRIPRKHISELVSIIEEEEDPPSSNLNIVFVSDTFIKKLNKQYRNKPKATDVLSFNMDSTDDEDSILGEIYISTDTVTKNAKKMGVTFRDEILRLCCHGFLHLLGYDHERSDDRKIMQARENYYLSKQGC